MNINGTFNYTELIIDTVEVELFFKGHKEVYFCNF